MTPSLSRLRNLQVSRDSRGVLGVVLDVAGRPYNVLTSEVFAELQSLVDELEHAPGVRLAVFRGKESGFLAGADLRELLAIESPQVADQVSTIGQKVFERIAALPMPTVAAIHGPCLGGGLELALACRYRVARDDERTQLGCPEVELGLLPAWGGTQRLPELIGWGAGLRMLVVARRLSAREAVERGLVDAAWLPNVFDEELERFIVDRLEGKPLERSSRRQVAKCRVPARGASRARPATEHTAPRRPRVSPDKAAVCHAVEQGLRFGRDAGLAVEREAFAELLFQTETRQRIESFLNRRRPSGNRPGESPFSAPWVDGLTIGEVLRQTARRNAAGDAMIFPQAGVRMTWGEFDRAVDRVARGLLGLGFRRGDRFGVWSTNWPEWVVLQFATARIGVVLVTINPAYRPAELRFALAQSEVRGLALVERFKSSHYFDMLREVCPSLDEAQPGELNDDDFPHLRWIVRLRGSEHSGMLAWKALEETGDSVPPSLLEEAQRQLSCRDPINLQYTSGTTGMPKGSLLSHRNILLNAFFAAAGQGLRPSDRICLPVPLYHCFGCVLGTMCAAVTGATMVFPRENFDAEATLAAVETHGCTAIYGVPMMFIAELEHPSFPSRNTSSLRTGIMAGSPCPVELMKRVTREMGAREITIAYGQTEASPLITMTRTDDPIDKRVATVGRPLPGIEVKIVDRAGGEPLADGRSGELCCRGHNVMLGYYHMPEATANAIDAEGWLHTGDLAVRQPDGYYRITGRSKEMIIRGGENIAPREIEELLYQHPQVEQVSVVGVPDRRYGEAILAWIKLRAGQSATEDEIRAFCRARLAHFKTPRYVKFVEQFPMTVTGKIQKYRIRELAIAELGLAEAAATETA